jgi:hypothetical protein
MGSKTALWLQWVPRILGIAVALFVGLFALDAFGQGRPLAQALGDFAIHLIPAFLLLAVVAVAWRYPWVGAVAFMGLAVAYAISARRVDWIAVIAGPLFIVGVLFLLSGARAPAPRA